MWHIIHKTLPAASHEALAWGLRRIATLWMCDDVVPEWRMMVPQTVQTQHLGKGDSERATRTMPLGFIVWMMKHSILITQGSLKVPIEWTIQQPILVLDSGWKNPLRTEGFEDFIGYINLTLLVFEDKNSCTPIEVQATKCGATPTTPRCTISKAVVQNPEIATRRSRAHTLIHTHIHTCTRAHTCVCSTLFRKTEGSDTVRISYTVISNHIQTHTHTHTHTQ